MKLMKTDVLAAKKKAKRAIDGDKWHVPAFWQNLKNCKTVIALCDECLARNAKKKPKEAQPNV